MANMPPPPQQPQQPLSPEDSERQSLVLKLLTRLRCVACGRPYTPHDCTLIDRRPDAWVLGVQCHRCKTAGYVMFVLDLAEQAKTLTELTPDEQEEAARRPAISGDDVLDVHALLDNFEGDVDVLLS